MPDELSPEAFQRWLSQRSTKAVFHMMEQLARPQALTERASESDSSYRLGYVTGFWDALDQMRELVSAPEEEVEATYQGEY